jgi:hypothetical protein
VIVLGLIVVLGLLIGQRIDDEDEDEHDYGKAREFLDRPRRRRRPRAANGANKSTTRTSTSTITGRRANFLIVLVVLGLLMGPTNLPADHPHLALTL